MLIKFKVFATSIRSAFERLFSFATLLLLALSWVLLTSQVSHAQVSLPEGLSQGNYAKPPSEVKRYGNIETIQVQSPLSSQTLFTIASETAYDRSPDALEGRQTVEQRAEEVTARLLLLLTRPMDPETLVFEVSRLNNVVVIDVRDDYYPRPLILISVTETDADFNGLPIDQLADQWHDILEQDLRTGLVSLPAQRQRSGQILVGLLVLTGVMVLLKYGLSRRQKTLRHQKRELKKEAASERSDAIQSEQALASEGEQLAQERSRFLQELQQLFSLDHQLGALDFTQWLSFWLLILAWFVGFLWLFKVSPYLLKYNFYFVDSILQLIILWFLIGLAIRISHRLINRFINRWEGPPGLVSFTDAGADQRRQLRASTIAGAAKGLATVLITGIGFLWALGAVGLPTGSVVAIGGLIGLAISFGSQSLVKDLVNGFLILAEDQYAIGDVINLGFVSGVVESLNLRVTQIRSGGGELVTIPNSRINEVKNLTRSWSRVDFSIDVAYKTDPEKALLVLQEVAQKLYADPEWHDKIVAEPTVLGIDSVSHSGMTITTWIQTEPAQQWSVGREFRLRVRKTLEANGIEIGTPRQTYALEAQDHDQPKGRE